MIVAGKVLAVLQYFLGVGEQLGAKNIHHKYVNKKLVSKLFFTFSFE